MPNISSNRTVLVVTALSEERQAVISFLSSVGTGQDDFDTSFVKGEFLSPKAERPWKIILPAPTRAGNVKSAAKTALNLSMRPDLTFFVGVAGGFPHKVNMFDVVVADRVYFVEPAKIDIDASYIPRPDQHHVTAKLLSRAQSLQDIGGWQDLLGADKPNKVQVWIEPIAAGEKLVASSASEDFKRIKQSAPRAVAVENEGFGVLEAAHEAAASAIVIRGISDLLDNRPADGADAAREPVDVVPDHLKIKAARHAAAFMFGMLALIDQEGSEEIEKAEDEYVVVKLKWKDLKDLTRGRTLAMELVGDAPIFDISSRPGSVIVEFKTIKVFAAILYAISLEKSFLAKLIDLEPDIIETMLDTSDPAVSEAIVGVRLLGSSKVQDQIRGRRLLDKLVQEYPGLKSFSGRLNVAANFSATNVELPEELLDFNNRTVQRAIQDARSVGFITMGDLDRLLPKRDVSSESIEALLERLSEMRINVIEEADDIDARVTTGFSEEAMIFLDRFMRRSRIVNYSAAIRAIVKEYIAENIGDELEISARYHVRSVRRFTVLFKGREADMLRRFGSEARLSLASVVRQAVEARARAGG